MVVIYRFFFVFYTVYFDQVYPFPQNKILSISLHSQLYSFSLYNKQTKIGKARNKPSNTHTQSKQTGKSFSFKKKKTKTKQKVYKITTEFILCWSTANIYYPFLRRTSISFTLDLSVWMTLYPPIRKGHINPVWPEPWILLPNDTGSGKDTQDRQKPQEGGPSKGSTECKYLFSFPFLFFSSLLWDSVT